MPRLHQVPRSEARAEIVTVMYDMLFDDRDPVAEPGTATGTPGDWWTVFANSPDVLQHAVQGFGLYQSSKRVLDPVLRELGQTRVGWAAGSQFVFSQHCKSLRALGVSEERIAAIAHWGAADCFTELERLVLAYTDCLVYDRGRVPDALFEQLRGPPLRRRGVGADVRHHALPPARRDVPGAPHRVRRRRRAGRRGRGARGLRSQGHRARHQRTAGSLTLLRAQGDRPESFEPATGR